MISRIVEWWGRTCWGWLAILGPVICYLALLYSLDLVGMAADGGFKYFQAVEGAAAFRSGVELDLISLAGRMEYALVSALYILVGGFSIIWALPKILARTKNPFGGLFGAAIALGLSAFLYFLFWISEYNVRIAFADDVLRLGEQAGALADVNVSFVPFGFSVFKESMPPSEMLGMFHSIIYAIGNTAPWVLMVFMATIASFEPRTLGRETRRSLRQRMAELQVALVLAALNIVLSVAYTRTMMVWPVNLLNDELSVFFVGAATRYAAVFGALGTVMLIAVLAPAYLALTRQFDRIAEAELLAEGDDYVSFEERLEWRRKHGLLLSSQQAIAAAGAVLAPLMTGPTLDSAQGTSAAPSAYEQSINVR